MQLLFLCALNLTSVYSQIENCRKKSHVLGKRNY